jgi:hypothetical protein
MKNNILKTIFTVSLALMSFSCQKYLDELRVNPNAVTTIDDAALFTKAVRSLFQNTTNQSASRFAGQYAHYFMAGSTARFPDQYTDGFDGEYNSMLTGMYGGTIRHIEEVLAITSTGTTKNDVRYAMANVISVLGYAWLTDAFGDIPYTQGGKGKTQDIINPKYDSQQNIYPDLIAQLTKSIDVLKSAKAGQGYPNADPIFKNDLTKWVRFANSVRLRLAMRLRYANLTLSQQSVTQCLASPLMETNDHNPSMIETEGNGNAWFTNRTNFPSIKMSTFLINQLKTTSDPRMAVYVSKDANGQYSGITNGLNDATFGNTNFAAKSDMGLALSSKDSKLYLITASEVWFLRAEASLIYDKSQADASLNFKKGIETSLNQWEIPATEISAFLASKNATLDNTKTEEQIGKQMWVALVPNYFEAWNYIKRTGYPVIPVRTDPTLSQGVTKGIMPKRFLYSSFELSSNGTNVNEAIGRQGANKIDTPVWWDKN